MCSVKETLILNSFCETTVKIIWYVGKISKIKMY